MDAKSTIDKVADGFVQAKRVQVPGMLIIEDPADPTGERYWTIPIDDSFDDAKLYKSPFDIKQHPDFYYQFERKEWVPGMISEGFVTCSRKELGVGVNVNNAQSNEFSAGADTTYVVDDELVCIKIPKVLEQRKRKALKRLSDAAIRATEPKKKGESDAEFAARMGQQPTSDPERRESAARMASNSGGRRYEMRHETIIARPKHPENEQI